MGDTDPVSDTYPVPILGPDGKIVERQLPSLTPRDAAVAQLVADPGTETGQAVRSLLGGAVTADELEQTLTGYVRPADLAGYATDADVAAKQDALPWIDVFYDPVNGWANPALTPGKRFRRFDSVLYVNAPNPPSLPGVNGDRWTPHPQSPIWATVNA